MWIPELQSFTVLREYYLMYFTNGLRLISNIDKNRLGNQKLYKNRVGDDHAQMAREYRNFMNQNFMNIVRAVSEEFGNTLFSYCDTII